MLDFLRYVDFFKRFYDFLRDFMLIFYQILCFVKRFYVGEVSSSINHQESAQIDASGFIRKVRNRPNSRLQF